MADRPGSPCLRTYQHRVSNLLVGIFLPNAIFSLSLDVNHCDIIVKVRTNPKLLVEVNLLNVKLLFFLIHHLNHIVTNPE